MYRMTLFIVLCLVVLASACWADSLNVRLVGSHDTPGQAYAMAIRAGFVYVADGYGGLRVIDATDPAHPVEAGNCPLAGGPQAIALRDTLAYLACGSGGLRVVNVADPAHPTEVGAITGYTDVRDIDIAGDRVYLADWSYGLYVATIGGDGLPATAGGWSGFGNGSCVAADGDHAYLGGWYGAPISLIDCSNPSSPRVISSLNMNATNQDLAVSGGMVYAGLWASGLRLVDFSDTLSPVPAGSIGGFDATGIAIGGDCAYIAAGNAGLRVIRISQPANLVTRGHYTTAGSAEGVALGDSLVFLACGDAGLKILNYYGMTGAGERKDDQTSIGDGGLRVAGTTIGYDVARPGRITLRVYDMLGRPVRTLCDGFQVSGLHVSCWDGRDGSGRRAASGVYIVRLRTNSTAIHAKMVVIR